MAYNLKSNNDEYIITNNGKLFKEKKPENQLQKIIMIKFKNFPALGIIFSLEKFNFDVGIDSFSDCFKKIISINEDYLRDSIGINFLETGNYLRCIPQSNIIDELGENYSLWEELNEVFFDESNSNENVKYICDEINRLSKIDYDLILDMDLSWGNFIKELHIIKNFKKIDIIKYGYNYEEYKIKNKNYLYLLKKNIGSSILGSISFLENSKTDYFDIVPDLGSGILTSSLRNFLEKKFNQHTLETTSIEIPVGFISGHKDAVMGRNGHAFLTTGSNNLIYQYKEEKKSTSLDWFELIKLRNEKVFSLNSNFIQIIIPEKISVYPDLFPYKIKTPTKNLSELEDKVFNKKFYLSILDLFSKKSQEKREMLYKKIDTHLQPLGSYEIFSYIALLMFNFVPEEKKFNQEIISKGDLSDRILGDFIYDKFYNTENDAFMNDRINVETSHNLSKKQTGQYSVWNNPSAPIKKKVIAFGNSFFGNCLDQGCIGWWFSNYVENFICIWSPNMDINIIKNENPDLVICQTAERFMDIVPEC